MKYAYSTGKILLYSVTQDQQDRRPDRQWMKENGICEKTYYLWQRRIRQETYELMNAPAERIPILSGKEEISFAEIPLWSSNNCADIHSKNSRIMPVAVIKTPSCQIALSGDIPETLLTKILREVSQFDAYWEPARGRIIHWLNEKLL